MPRGALDVVACAAIDLAVVEGYAPGADEIADPIKVTLRVIGQVIINSGENSLLAEALLPFAQVMRVTIVVANRETPKPAPPRSFRVSERSGGALDKTNKRARPVREMYK